MLKRTGAPHEPPMYTDAILYAVRALESGTANDGQQKMAWEWIVYHAAGYNNLSYWPSDDSGRATAFMEGRRFVGSQMLKLLQPALTPSKPPEEEAPSDKPKRVKRPSKL